MPESDELNAAIGHIKYKVDSMDRTLERLLRVNGKAMIADYMEQFAADPILAKVYLRTTDVLSGTSGKVTFSVEFVNTPP